MVLTNDELNIDDILAVATAIYRNFLANVNKDVVFGHYYFRISKNIVKLIEDYNKYVFKTYCDGKVKNEDLKTLYGIPIRTDTSMDNLIEIVVVFVGG